MNPLTSLEAVLRRKQTAFPTQYIKKSLEEARMSIELLRSSPNGIMGTTLVDETRAFCNYIKMTDDEKGRHRVTIAYLLLVLNSGRYVHLGKDGQYIPNETCSL
jgi:hypothetical protein